MIEEYCQRFLHLLFDLPGQDTSAAKKTFNSEVSASWFAEYDVKEGRYNLTTAYPLIYDLCSAYYRAFNKLPTPEIASVKIQGLKSLDVFQKEEIIGVLNEVIAVDANPSEYDYLRYELRKLYVRNELIHRTSSMLQVAEEDPVKAMRLAIANLTDLSSSIQSHNTLDSNTVWLGGLVTEYRDRIVDDAPMISGVVPYPFHSWNRVLGGMRPGELIVLAASFNVGKSFVMHEIAYAAAESGFTTVMAELEMLYGPLMMRMAARIAGLPSRKIEDKKLTPKEMERLIAAFDAVVESNEAKKLLLVPAIRAETPEMLKMEIEQQLGDESPHLIGIDYFDKMRPSRSKYNDSTQAKSDLCDELVNLGKYFVCPMMTALHLNREKQAQYQFMERKADVMLKGVMCPDHPYIPPTNTENDWVGKPGKLIWNVYRNRNGVKGDGVNLPLRVEYATNSIQSYDHSQDVVDIAHSFGESYGDDSSEVMHFDD